MSTVILGMGNTILSDDGVGIFIVREVKKKLKRADVDVKETSLAGIYLVDLLAGYDKAIVVDAIRTENGRAGEIFKFSTADFNVTTNFTSAHHINLSSAIEIGRKLGVNIPEEILIIAVEVCNTETFSEGCTTREVVEAIPKVVKMILDELH